MGPSCGADHPSIPCTTLLVRSGARMYCCLTSASLNFRFLYVAQRRVCADGRRLMRMARYRRLATSRRPGRSRLGWTVGKPASGRRKRAGMVRGRRGCVAAQARGAGAGDDACACVSPAPAAALAAAQAAVSSAPSRYRKTLPEVQQQVRYRCCLAIDCLPPSTADSSHCLTTDTQARKGAV